MRIKIEAVNVKVFQTVLGQWSNRTSNVPEPMVHSHKDQRDSEKNVLFHCPRLLANSQVLNVLASIIQSQLHPLIQPSYQIRNVDLQQTPALQSLLKIGLEIIHLLCVPIKHVANRSM